MTPIFSSRRNPGGRQKSTEIDTPSLRPSSLTVRLVYYKLHDDNSYWTCAVGNGWGRGGS